MDDLNMRDLVARGAVAASAGLLGRLMAMSRNPTKRLGWNLLWELPVAFGLGLLGVSLGEHFRLGPWEAYGLSICIAYVGPPAIDEILQRWRGVPPAPPSAQGPQS